MDEIDILIEELDKDGDGEINYRYVSVRNVNIHYTFPARANEVLPHSQPYNPANPSLTILFI